MDCMSCMHLYLSNPSDQIPRLDKCFKGLSNMYIDAYIVNRPGLKDICIFHRLGLQIFWCRPSDIWECAQLFLRYTVALLHYCIFAMAWWRFVFSFQVHTCLVKFLYAHSYFWLEKFCHICFKDLFDSDMLAVKHGARPHSPGPYLEGGVKLWFFIHSVGTVTEGIYLTWSNCLQPEWFRLKLFCCLSSSRQDAIPWPLGP